MNNSRKRGATLGLVAALALVITLLGIAFFFFAKLVGGHRELERATDSGNLNVAKQSLRSPYLRVFTNNGYAGPFDLSDPILSQVQQNFSLLADQSTGASNGQLDLLTYDRVVAQAFLVSLNAAADGSDLGLPPSQFGIQRAQAVIGLLNDPSNGVGVALARKLKSDSAIDQNFTKLADGNSVPMLKGQELTQSISTVRDISYMVRGNAGNVFLDPNVLPGNFNPGNVAGNFVSENGVQYLSGYNFLSVAGVTDNNNNALMGVPLRPGRNPHLVNDLDFQTFKSSPLSGNDPSVQTRVPPNAFLSGGSDLDGRTGLFASATSCAIAGSITLAPQPGNGPNPFPGPIPSNGPFPIDIPNGYLVVVNGGGTEPTTAPGPIGLGTGPNGQSSTPCFTATVSADPTGQPPDVFSGLMMGDMSGHGGHVWVLETQPPSSPPNYAVSIVGPDSGSQGGGIGNVQQAKWNHWQNFHRDMSDSELLQAVGVGTSSPNLSGNSTASILADAKGLPMRDVANQGPDPNMAQCNDINSDPNANEDGGDFPIVTACVNAREKIAGIFGPPGGGSGPSVCLSALEFSEAVTITSRESGNDATIIPLNTCTGLDAFQLDPTRFNNDSIQKSPPSINALINPSNGTFEQFGNTAPGDIGYGGLTKTRAQQAYNDFVVRIAEIQPDYDPNVVAGFLNTPLPLGSIRAIWLDTSNQQSPVLRMTDPTDPNSHTPSRVNISSVQLDGTPVIATTDLVRSGQPNQPLQLLSSSGGGNGYLDRNGDAGYTHPYDCTPNAAGTVTSSATWTPNSGYGALLGVLRFQNCVNDNGGMNLACPC